MCVFCRSIDLSRNIMELRVCVCFKSIKYSNKEYGGCWLVRVRALFDGLPFIVNTESKLVVFFCLSSQTCARFTCVQDNPFTTWHHHVIRKVHVIVFLWGFPVAFL